MPPQLQESQEVRPVYVSITFVKLVHSIFACLPYTIFLMSVEGQIGVNKWMQLFSICNPLSLMLLIIKKRK
jgi:hypothetical protein